MAKKHRQLTNNNSTRKREIVGKPLKVNKEKPSQERKTQILTLELSVCVYNIYIMFRRIILYACIVYLLCSFLPGVELLTSSSSCLASRTKTIFLHFLYEPP